MTEKKRKGKKKGAQTLIRFHSAKKINSYNIGEEIEKENTKESTKQAKA